MIRPCQRCPVSISEDFKQAISELYQWLFLDPCLVFYTSVASTMIEHEIVKVQSQGLGSGLNMGQLPRGPSWKSSMNGYIMINYRMISRRDDVMVVGEEDQAQMASIHLSQVSESLWAWWIITVNKWIIIDGLNGYNYNTYFILISPEKWRWFCPGHFGSPGVHHLGMSATPWRWSPGQSRWTSNG